MQSFTTGKIERISFDHGIEFLLEDGSICRIETEFSIKQGTSTPSSVDPGNLSRSDEEILALLTLLQKQASIDISGSSLLINSEEPKLLVEVLSSNDFESWMLFRPDTTRIVCEPGGKVTNFTPE